MTPPLDLSETVAFSSLSIASWIVPRRTSTAVPAGPVPVGRRARTFDWIGVRRHADVAPWAVQATYDLVPPIGNAGDFPTLWRSLREANLAASVKVTLPTEVLMALLIPRETFHVFALVGLRDGQPAMLPTFPGPTPATIRVAIEQGVIIDSDELRHESEDGRRGVLISAVMAFMIRRARAELVRDAKLRGTSEIETDSKGDE